MSKISLPLKDIFCWDVANWSRAVRLWDDALGKILGRGKALDIGAREGGLTLYLALNGHNVVCTDVESPELLARQLHLKHGVAESVSYDSLNATCINYPDQTFDIVAFKSVLGAVGRYGNKELQHKAVHEMYRILKPGGILLFAENLIGSPIHRFMRNKFTEWGRDWRYPTRAEMIVLLSDFSEVSTATFGFLATFGRSERQRNALHTVDLILNPIIPRDFRYIIFGTARK